MISVQDIFQTAVGNRGIRTTNLRFAKKLLRKAASSSSQNQFRFEFYQQRICVESGGRARDFVPMNIVAPQILRSPSEDPSL